MNAYCCDKSQDCKFEKKPEAIKPEAIKLEAVITCVQYADFLAHTLPLNARLFDRMVVVTSPEDSHTRRVCEFWNVECVLTDRFRSHWGEFHKGAGINEGLDRLAKDAWLIHMDGDIVLPPLTRKILQAADLDKQMIYGCDRYMVRSYAEWAQFVDVPRLQQENNSWVHIDRTFEMGTRVALPEYGGYVPIGFFQMWHSSNGFNKYPESHRDAARGDMQFALQWPRARRALLAEIIAYHLESERADMGANWGGRKTVQFATPEAVKPAVRQTLPAL